MGVQEILASYDDQAPLNKAYTIPAPWYVDARIAELERQTVFSKTWQVDRPGRPGGEAGAVRDRNRSGRTAGRGAWE